MWVIVNLMSLCIVLTNINKLVEVVIAGRDDEKYLYHLNTCDKSEVLFYRLCLESFVIVLSAHVSQLTQVPDS